MLYRKKDDGTFSLIDLTKPFDFGNGFVVYEAKTGETKYVTKVDDEIRLYDTRKMGSSNTLIQNPYQKYNAANNTWTRVNNKEQSSLVITTDLLTLSESEKQTLKQSEQTKESLQELKNIFIRISKNCKHNHKHKRTPYTIKSI